MSSPAATPRIRRDNSRRTSMFLRMLWRAAVLRRGRAASALLAMIVAAATATAMLNLYVDVQAKMRREFRNYGANIVVVGKNGQSLSSGAQAKVDSIVAGHGLAVPFAYVVAATADGHSIVVSGINFSAVRDLDRWWAVTSWPQTSHEALLGVRAAAVATPDGTPFDLTFHGKTIRLKPTGTVQTGAAEDSRIYLSLEDFENWTGVQPSTIEVAAYGRPQEIGVVMAKLSKALPDAEVRPIRQIMEGEAHVLGKTRSTLLASTALIILTAALCLLATLVGWVYDRRHDFAIMKALGASERLVNGFVATEAVILGSIGAFAGYGLGIGVAAWIGQVNFHAPVSPRWSVLPPVLAGAVLVALIASVAPMFLLRRVQPANILRGE
jgi:putative ABC transport system permease protein